MYGIRLFTTAFSFSSNSTKHANLTLLFYKREGKSLSCCSNYFLVNLTVIIQVTSMCVYALNKYLNVLSSTIYQI